MFFYLTPPHRKQTDMINNLTQALEEFEALVKAGKMETFWVAVRKDGLRIKAVKSNLERLLPLTDEMFDSLNTFFYGVERIEYATHDYTNLKSFINARVMIDHVLKQASN